MLLFIIISVLLINYSSTQRYVSLPPLPYAYDALEPILSEHLMRLHHLQHHQAYTNKVNAALQSMVNETKDETIVNLANSDIMEIITNLNHIPEKYRLTLRNNGGGFVNHRLFWLMMRPPMTGNKKSSEQMPDGPLRDAINNKFGNFSAFKQQFTDKALNLFGSGWVWLYLDGDSNELVVNTTANQDNPVMFNKHNSVILGLDVWEHAYYLNYEKSTKRICKWLVVSCQLAVR